VVIGVGGFLGVGEHLVALPSRRSIRQRAGRLHRRVSGPNAPEPPASPTTTGAAGTTPERPRRRRSKPNPWYPDHRVINATKDELKAMPEFKYST